MRSGRVWKAEGLSGYDVTILPKPQSKIYKLSSTIIPRHQIVAY
jgi:hypothetical protein